MEKVLHTITNCYGEKPDNIIFIVNSQGEIFVNETYL
jgi:hypothetical protein